MEKRTVVYAVASGVYDRYGVHGVFSTAERAQAFADKWNEDRDDDDDNFAYIHQWFLDECLDA